MPRAIIYARFSTERQDKLTIAAQIDQCRKYAATNGIEVIATFHDDAVTGSYFFSRPGIQSALAMLTRREATILICTSPDRVSRDSEHTDNILKKGKFLGFTIHYAQSNGTLSDLETRLRAALSAEQLEDISVKTREGQKAHFQGGKAVAGIAYGYRMVIEHDFAGNRIKGLREVHPDEKKVVQWIFGTFASGVSPAEIADTLNRQNVPAPREGPWRGTTIRGHAKRGTGILNNEAYIGRLIWNRQSYRKNPDTERRNARMNDPDLWATRYDETLRIVSDDQWAKVKAQQALVTRVFPEKSGNRLVGTARKKHAYSGIIVCGECGQLYATTGRNRYGCSRHRDKLGCGNSRTVCRLQLEHRINAAIPDALMSTSSIEDIQLRADLQWRAEQKAAVNGVDERKRNMARIDKELGNLVNALKNGNQSPSILAAIAQLDAKKSEIESAREEYAEEARPPRISASILNSAVRAMALTAASASLEQEPTEKQLEFRRRWNVLAKSIVEKIVVTPAGRGVTLQVHGKLPALLASMKAWELEEKSIRERHAKRFRILREDGNLGDIDSKMEFVERMNDEIQKRKRPFERFQFGVVAGAGFEPATFRL